MRLPSTIVVYVRSMNKIFRVAALIRTKSEPAYRRRHPEDVVVACWRGFSAMANSYSGVVRPDDL